MSTSIKNDQFDMSAVPTVIPGLDLNKLQFSPEEGFLFSRVDGTTTIGVLVKSSGMKQQLALSTLSSLMQKGAITWEGAATRHKKSTNKSTKDKNTDQDEIWDDSYLFDPYILAEQVDLKEYSKKKFLYLYDMIDGLTYYDLLRVDRRADVKAIKRAYFRVSREFHPDSFFRKNLGSYRSMIETLFKRVGNAYEVLSDPDMRKQYDDSIPSEPDPEDQMQQHQNMKQTEKDQRLAKERRDRLLRRSPIMSRKIKALKYHQDALKEQAKNDPVAAANSIRLALTLDPKNSTYQDLFSKVGPKAGAIRYEKELRRGKAEESMGCYDEALQAYFLAIENNPREPEALTRAASLMCSLKRDLRQALSFCRKALMIEPDNFKHRLALSEIYSALGMEKNALRELVEYVRYNPLDEQAAQKLSMLKSKKKDGK